MKNNNRILLAQYNVKFKPVLSLFSSPVLSLNVPVVEMAIKPKMDVPDETKDVTQIYRKNKPSNALF